jgi:hypothetical protein
MKIGFTGTRHGMTELQWRAFLAAIKREWPHEFHHGDCVGADDEAANIVYDHRGGLTKIIKHPPINRAHQANNQCYHGSRPPREYLERNRCIVDETMHLIAAPKEMSEQRFGGTWATIRYARKMGRRVTICWPDGTTTEEPLNLEKAFTKD